MNCRNITRISQLLILSVMVLFINEANAQNFFSIKYRTEQPLYSGGGTSEIEDSTEFNSGNYKEVFYASPADKPFSVSLSALLNDDNEVDQIKAFLGWGGIATLVSVGEISGTFTPKGNAVLPGNQNQHELFQTILPSEKEFMSESKFFGVGKGSQGMTMGIGHLVYQAPSSIWVEANQEYVFGYNSATGEYENYHPEGTYPTEIVDAYWETQMTGLWIRMDYLQAVADENATNVPALKYFRKTATEKLGIGFGLDILMGYIKGTHGENVIDDYKIAVSAVDLEIEDTETFGIRSSYDVGVFYVKKISDFQLLLNAGVEGLIMNNFDLDDPNPDFGGATDTVYGEKFNDSSTISYSYYFRFGFTY